MLPWFGRPSSPIRGEENFGEKRRLRLCSENNMKRKDFFDKKGGKNLFRQILENMAYVPCKFWQVPKLYSTTAPIELNGKNQFQFQRTSWSYAIACVLTCLLLIQLITSLSYIPTCLVYVDINFHCLDIFQLSLRFKKFASFQKAKPIPRYAVKSAYSGQLGQN